MSIDEQEISNVEVLGGSAGWVLARCWCSFCLTIVLGQAGFTGFELMKRKEIFLRVVSGLLLELFWW
jgi:hypothetical protein